MSGLKKTAIAVLVFGSSSVFAGTMGPVCTSVNATAPCESIAWEFGAKALYMKANVDSLSGYDPFVPGIIDVSPGYKWGFQIEGAYYFSTGSDLDVNWYHMGNSAHGTLGPNTLSALTNPITGVATSVTQIDGTSNIHPKWDAVNIELGQLIDVGPIRAFRLHGGAQWARVSNDRNHTVDNVITTGGVATPYTHTSTYKPTYNGFGPRLGMDVNYGWENGLGVYANGAASLLAGSRSYNFTYVDSTGNNVYLNNSNTAIVPELDAKLGVNYNYAIAQGDLTLDVAWMWVDYIGAHTNTIGNNFNVGLEGLVFGLKWKGNLI